MATMKAYGSITIVDIGDLGTLSVCPEANSPISVIYDPNAASGSQYNPDWSTSPLRVSASAYYGGEELNQSKTGFTLTWSKRLGNSTTTNQIGSVTKGVVQYKNNNSSEREEVINSDGTLEIKNNILSLDIPMVTYICTATYIEPQSQIKLTAIGQMTFSLIAQPVNIKSCTIRGESSFLYDGTGALKGMEKITLTGLFQNCTFKAWQYKNSNGGWTDIDDSNLFDAAKPSFLELDIKNHSQSVNTLFNNGDYATIRLLAKEENDSIYDIHNITKIRQGSAGTEILNVVLSNEDMYVPCNSDGTLTDGALVNASTQIIVYEGANDITFLNNATAGEVVSYDVSTTDNIGGDWDTSDGTKKVYKVTNMTPKGGDTGTVTFTITRIGKNEKGEPYEKKTVKILYLTKIKQGLDGTSPLIRSIKVSNLTVTRSVDSDEENPTYTYSPSSFTVSAVEYNGNVTNDYSGRFRVSSYSGSTHLSTSTTRQNSTSHTVSITNTTNQYSHFVVELLPPDSDQTVQALDRQTITVVSDGKTGASGEDAIAFDMGNPADVIPCFSDGTVINDREIIIPFTAYQGGTKIRCTATLKDGIATNSADGPTEVSITNAVESNNYQGSIKIKFTKGSSLGSRDSGSVNILLTAGPEDKQISIIKTYSWSKGRQGDEAITLTAYGKQGNVLNQNDRAVYLSANFTRGAQDLAGVASWQWAKYDFNSNKYVNISGATSQDYTVTPAQVHSYASYSVTATYSGTPYVAYINVEDKTDPLQIVIHSSLGDKITNGRGSGCLYATVTQGGVPVDDLQHLIASPDAPASPSEGDIWAKVVANSKTIILQKWTTDQWIELSEKEKTWQCTYKWTFSDANGNPTTLGPNGFLESNERFLFIDGERINTKTQFNLEVSQNLDSNSNS